MSGLVIIESTVIALAARPLADWQPGQLGRIAALVAQKRIGDGDGHLHSTDALAEVAALQLAGYEVAVWRPEKERAASTRFWAREGIEVLDGTWRLAVDQHADAAFIVAPSKRHRSTPAYRDRMTTGSLLNLPSCATRAAAAILERTFYA